MLQEYLNQDVVIDLRGPFVCLGTLAGVDELYLQLRDADFHDLRDTHSSRENYVIAVKKTGVKRNRKHVLVMRSEVVAIGRLKDVVDE